MRLWKRLELEWKILILAVLLFSLLLWPFRSYTEIRLQEASSLSVDTQLEPVLVHAVENAQGVEREKAVQSLEHFRQWRAITPMLLLEQRRATLVFSYALLVALVAIAGFTLRRLTRPLKTLAIAATAIGRGEHPVIQSTSGGSLGRLETAMAAMEEELGRHRTHLLTEGMERAWRDMARVMAHEIKNPLTPIRLSMDRLDEKIREGKEVSSEEWGRFSERVTVQLDQLERLVSSFSSFAKEPEVRAVPFDPRAVVERVAEGFRGTMKLEFQGVVEAFGDPLLLQQIALNLLKNSREAGATKVVLRFLDEGERALVECSDNGPGIPKEAMEQVFLPYVTTKSTGSGLGLAVVKRLMESMRGSVQIKSDNGLCVRLYFPKEP